MKDLYPAIISQALKQKIELAKLFQKELKNKEIIFYFRDPAKEQIATNQNFAGKIPTDQELKDLFETGVVPDYLYINSNSYSGDKSSLKVKESIDYRTKANEQGKLVGDLRLTRVHSGTYLWPDGPNDTWIRVFVPEGTEILSAKLNGQDISKDVTVGGRKRKKPFSVIKFLLIQGRLIF